jgi:hypothetical protein
MPLPAPSTIAIPIDRTAGDTVAPDERAGTGTTDHDPGQGIVAEDVLLDPGRGPVDCEDALAFAVVDGVGAGG